MAVYRQCAKIFKPIIANNSAITLLTETRPISRWVAPTLKELARRKEKLDPKPPNPRSTYLEWNYDAEVFAFGKRLQESFDRDVLQQALTHRSYINQQEMDQRKAGIENPQLNMQDNRSLVQEGEKLISNYVKRFLRQSLAKFPDEGVNAVHDYLVTVEMLAKIASHIGLKDITLCADFPVENETLASTFKAVVAALHHSSGTNRAEAFVRDFVLTQLNGKDVNDIWVIKNPLEMLNKLLAEQNIPEPEPRLCNEAGKNSILAVYQVGLYSNKKLVGIGWGESIPIAQEMAARDGLRRLFETTDTVAPLQFKKQLAESVPKRISATS